MEKRISINQLAEYSGKKSEKSKLSLIRKQKEQKAFFSFWYKTAFASIRKSIIKKGSLIPIYEGIERLTKKEADTDTQKRNNAVSIEALERFVSIRLPKTLIDSDIEILKLDRKFIGVSGLNLYLSPEVVF